MSKTVLMLFEQVKSGGAYVDEGVVARLSDAVISNRGALDILKTFTLEEQLCLYKKIAKSTDANKISLLCAINKNLSLPEDFYFSQLEDVKDYFRSKEDILELWENEKKDREAFEILIYQAVEDFFEIPLLQREELVLFFVKSFSSYTGLVVPDVSFRILGEGNSASMDNGVLIVDIESQDFEKDFFELIDSIFHEVSHENQRALKRQSLYQSLNISRSAYILRSYRALDTPR